MTGLRKKALERVFYIQYPVQFKKDTLEVQSLIDSGSEINARAPAYIKKLGLQV